MNLKENLVESRRFYHRIAEPGWMEFKTTINIIQTLKEIGVTDIKYGKEVHSSKDMLGMPPKERLEEYAKTINMDTDFDISEILQGYTGAVATIDTGNEGPTIGFRFDIDALGIEESHDDDHRPFKEKFVSENNFGMHACGHDGHLSIGLFLTDWIKKNKDKLKGKYILIFQPAEEGVRGAKSMTSVGVVDHVDYFFSSHLGLGVEDGKIGVGTTGFLATTKFDVSFKGVSAHAGAAPEKGKNANLGAASAILNLHTLPQISDGMARINVGVMKGGTVRNAISDNAMLMLETRGETEDIREILDTRTRQVIYGAALQYDLEYEIKEVGSAPALKKTDEEFYTKINSLLSGKGFNTFRGGILEGSEDVVYFMNRVQDNGGKAIHFIFGTKLAAGHHNNKFDFNESCLETGLNVFKECIKYLNKI